ncbi:COG1525 Micrococcal nuclease (thermonuclease) homologs [uncultured Caudovirales phage]|uniref:COG1525 Micrococcal nuclease (Thermonuclease) homologs n=1 Tax=uncultured Caudovirales phage TaxID=2100421 RepID=A0A6J7WC33_9CAUD|nr:COG1525 Micrococcal nuclease (thermonuclease) homologs [uncultured Caudovirales phage]
MVGEFLALVLLVNDGDTFKARVTVWDGIEVVTAVRLRGVDTPELRGKCASEKAAALAAKERLTSLLASGRVTLSRVEPDKFAGRVDAEVTVDGKAVASVLVAEGLARPYAGGARQSWCN